MRGNGHSKSSINHNAYIAKLKYLHELSQELSLNQPLNELLHKIISASKSLINAEASSLLLLDNDEKHLSFYSVEGDKKDNVIDKKVKVGDGIAGWVALKHKSLIIYDCYSDERFNPEFDIATGFNTRSMICVPMLKGEKLIGVIQVINKIDDSKFTNDDLELLETLASQCAISIENVRLIEIEIKSRQIDHEIKMAKNIQGKFLQTELPSFESADLNIYYRAAREVSGDFYYFQKVDENRTLISILDVSGKSISAALIVSAICSYIKTYFVINKAKFELTTFIRGLNKFLIDSTTSDKFATAWFGVLDNSIMEIESCNAGHNPSVYYNSKTGKLKELTVGGLLLGSIDMDYKSEKLILSSNDSITFFTDGITEAWNMNEDEYGEKRLFSLIQKCSELSANEIVSSIVKDLEYFVNGAIQSDDITLGVIKIKGKVD